jgi:gluconate 2-dehydrogenase alpha chain
MRKTDVVIVGLGAAGSYAALALTQAGLEVTALEAGPHWSAEDFPMDELRNDVRNFMSQPKAAKEIPTWRPNASQVASQTGVQILMMNGVGGSSIHYGMEQWRYLDWNFKERSQSIKRYGQSSIPPDSTIADWPISYADVSPYYDKVEWDMGVSGQAGNINGKKIAGGNSFEAPRIGGYPLPPLRRSGYNNMMADAAKGLGWHPFPGPASIRSKVYRNLAGCQYCGFCTYNGCMVEAKGSTNSVAIPEAQQTGRLKIVAGARVTGVNVDNHGRASGVTYLKNGRQFFQPADMVILATYVYENIRLLLLSKSKAFPNGLSNNHGQVGQNYISHVYAGASGLFPGKALNIYGGPGAQRTSVDDWNGDNFDHSGLGFIGGAIIDARMEGKPIAQSRAAPSTVPQWGSAWKQWINQNANSVGTIGTQVECLSYEQNYLDLDPTVKDPQGFPVIRATFDIGPQEVARVNYTNQKVVDLLQAAGASQVWTTPAAPIAVNSHAYGGARMGNDPHTSVVDKWSVSHEVPNLVVLGGATFPTSTAYNPTNTIEALSWRTGDHIAQNWKDYSA